MLVCPQVWESEEGLCLESGQRLRPLTLAYETYGELNARKDNAVLVCHGLSGTAHAAGRHRPEDRHPGWWDAAIGPGRPFDTDRFCVICCNVLGGAGGSSGPSSIDPSTGRPYALNFPVVTVADMVHAQARLLESLQIARLACVVGGCLGGFQALTWGRLYPERVGAVIALGATARTSAHSLAFFEVIRQAVRRDPHWAEGNYYDGPFPRAGLTLGSLIGMLFWMTPEAMEQRFGRRRRAGAPRYSLEPEFEMQTFLQGIADTVERRFDPNSLLYVTRAMDLFDLQGEAPRLSQALRGYQAPTLLLSYRSDWRYPPQRIEDLAEALRELQVPVQHRVLDSDFGHGAYLFDVASFAPEVVAFLRDQGDQSR